VLNWELLRHPLNWLIVGFMLLIAGAAGHLLLAKFEAQPAGPMPGTDATGYVVKAGPSRKQLADLILQG
jgi:hypothetical protein